MARGSEVGLRMKQLRQQARDSLLNYQARMAGIAASRANSRDRAAISREAMAAREADSARELQFKRDSLEQAGRLQEQKLEQDLMKSQLNPDSPFSYQVAGKGKVLKVDKRTGQYEEIDFPELRQDQSRFASLNALTGESDGLEGSEPNMKQWEQIDQLTNPQKGASAQQPQQQPGFVVDTTRELVTGRQPRNEMNIPPRYVIENGKLVKKTK
jgi:hypothetical protein